MSAHRGTALCRCLLLLGVLPCALTAQTADPPVCATTIAALGPSPRALPPDSGPSFQHLYACPSAGPPILANIWRRQDLTPLEFAHLLGRAHLLNDRRLADTLITITRRTANTSLHRQYALGALIRMQDPGAPRRLDRLRRNGQGPGLGTELEVSGARVGAFPVDAAARQRIAQLMADIGAMTTDVALVELAYAGMGSLEMAGWTNVKVPGNAVTLTYMCGNRFRIRNRSPLTLGLRWDVYGTSASGRAVYPSPPTGVAYADRFLTVPVRGTVRVFYGTQLLQTKANGGTTCP